MKSAPKCRCRGAGNGGPKTSAWGRRKSIVPRLQLLRILPFLICRVSNIIANQAVLRGVVPAKPGMSQLLWELHV